MPDAAHNRRGHSRALFGFCGLAVRRAAVIVATSASHLASGVSLSVKGMPFFLVEAIPIGLHCVADRVLLVRARDPVFAWRIDCARNISHARSSIGAPLQGQPCPGEPVRSPSVCSA